MQKNHDYKFEIGNLFPLVECLFCKATRTDPVYCALA